MPGTVPRWSWPKLGAVTNRIINVYYIAGRMFHLDHLDMWTCRLCKKLLCPKQQLVADMFGLPTPQVTLAQQIHWKKITWHCCRLICQRDAKHQIVFPAASDFCFSALLAMLASYPLVVARPHAELVPRPWKQLPPHQSARPVQEAKMHVLQVAHCKLDIMMIIKNVSTVQFHSLCSSYRPRPLPREFPHANLPLI